MINKLLPKNVNNNYDGLYIAKWLFLVITILTISRSLAHLFLPDGGAQSIATIPLDMFSTSAANVIIGMFAQWGLSQLMVGFIFVIVIWRYKSLIPLMWLFVLFEYGGRLLLGFYKPFETSRIAPGAIGNMIFPFLALLMLILSMKERKES